MARVGNHERVPSAWGLPTWGRDSLPLTDAPCVVPAQHTYDSNGTKDGGKASGTECLKPLMLHLKLCHII